MKSIPWYQSTILRGIIVAILSQIAARFGLANIFTDVANQQIATELLDGIGVLALSWAAHARVTKPVEPITGSAVAAKVVAVAVNVPSTVIGVVENETPKVPDSGSSGSKP